MPGDRSPRVGSTLTQYGVTVHRHAQVASRWAVAKVAIPEVARGLASYVPGFTVARRLLPRSAPGKIDDAFVRRHAFRTLEQVRAAGVDPSGNVLEIGVGDSLASGLAFIAAGARSYAAVDPFAGDPRSSRALQIYRQVEAMCAGNWRADVNVRSFPGSNASLHRCLFEELPGASRFDLIVSVSAVEHVWALNDFALATRRLLKPGGVALHAIDLGPHGRWEQFEDQLTFLRVPNGLWRLGRRRGIATRLRMHEVKAAFERAGLLVDVFNSGSFPTDRTSVDPRSLAKRFRHMSYDEVHVAGCTLRITHPIR